MSSVLTELLLEGFLPAALLIGIGVYAYLYPQRGRLVGGRTWQDDPERAKRLQESRSKRLGIVCLVVGIVLFGYSVYLYLTA